MALELDLAARMALHSCRFMLWQQAIARRQSSKAAKMAESHLADLRILERDFKSYWPLKNKGGTGHCAAFLRWRMADYAEAGGRAA